MKNVLKKGFAILLLISLLQEIFFPTIAWALTGGPSQPEVQSFEPAATTELVDPFSGDFVYNIPLMDVEGYPVNISYHSGITMDQEASWVGLGWNINPGSIGRQTRGLPDDFKDEKVIKKTHIRPNITAGGRAGIGVKLFGLDEGDAFNLSLGIGMGLYNNNYRGVGYEAFTSASLSAGSFKTDLRLGVNSQSGVSIDNQTSLTHRLGGLNSQAGYNTRQGLKTLTLSATKTLVKDPDLGPLVSVGARYNFVQPTFTPNYSFSMVNNLQSYTGSVGIEIFGLNGYVNLTGYCSSERLAQEYLEASAYGYLYSQYAKGSEEALHDFNREKDSQFSEEVPNLPVANYTYDVYSITGQGTGGSCRPFRGDVGMVYDRTNNVTTDDFSLGADLAFSPNLLHAGLDVSYTSSGARNGAWIADNRAAGTFVFKSKQENRLFEPVYFKTATDVAPVNQQYYDQFGGDAAVRVDLQRHGRTVTAMQQLETGTSRTLPGGATSMNLTADNRRMKRESRNQMVSFLTYEEAIKQHQGFGTTPQEQAQLSVPSQSYRKDHHIGEVTVLNEDGKRYVYGIPAYNTKQVEATFNVAGIAVSTGASTVTYNSGDNTTANRKGNDHFFASTELPAYAHSYLLTAILSDDYVDVTQNGISDDDLGTAIKINYDLKQSGYKWRVPYNSMEASLDEGCISTVNDNKGSYVYGEKEIWHVKSIESKNYIAEFITSARLDGLGVQSENGGRDANNKMYKLDEIKLYTKQAYAANGAQHVPIKTVNFSYDYSLCPRVDNYFNPANPSDAGGKLTLTKISFVYGNSNKSLLSPYKFVYSNNNPAYHLKKYDRWGNFKEPNPQLTNSLYPYSEQDPILSNQYASAWHLSKIIQPSGAELTIDYESDDYAYVQDRRAMQMVRFVGRLADIPANQVYNPASSVPTISNSSVDKNHFVFKLQQPIAAGTNYMDQLTVFRKQYLEDERGNINPDIYFKFFLDLKAGKKDYVPGYAQFDVADWAGNVSLLKSSTSGNYEYASIRFKTASLGDREGTGTCHPISRAGWQFLRLNVPDVLYNLDNSNTNQSALEQILAIPQKVIDQTAGLAQDFGTLYRGFNKSMKSQNFATSFVPEQSWIRLYSPLYTKKGGGVRVSQVRIGDKWSTIGGDGSDYEYGQQFNYQMEEILHDGRTAMISSGVAAYEPMIGNDENPFRQPIAYNKENMLAPDDRLYQEEPYGECFFPDAQVGYRQVTVSNIKRTNVNRNAPGYTVYQYYTAKEFPTLVERTPVDPIPVRPNLLFQFLVFESEDYLTASQGFKVELNDMHGKPKGVLQYAENAAAPYSSVAYTYKTMANNPKQLDNRVTTLSKTGVQAQQEIGKEMDVIADSRESSTEATGITAGINVDVFLAFVFPVVVPTVWPSFSSEKTRFRSMTLSKVIRRFGVLESVTSVNEGAERTTKNLVYDAESGKVLLSSTTNTFNDPEYTFNYPAGWFYPGMSQAYKNIGFEKTVQVGANGRVVNAIDPANLSDAGTGKSATTLTLVPFTPGDEVLLRPASGATSVKAWITDVSSNAIRLVNINGASIQAGSYTLKVIRSGYRNRYNESVGYTRTLINPINPVNYNLTEQSYENNIAESVLDAKAITFSDNWQVDDCSSYDADGCGLAVNSKNPYITGVKGNWRPQKEYVFEAARDHTCVRNTLADYQRLMDIYTFNGYFNHIRYSGTYCSFVPFWLYTPAYTGSLEARITQNLDHMDRARWVAARTITKYDRAGNALEEMDAIGNYSAALFSFRNTLPTAVSSNAQFKDIGYDSFEDYAIVDPGKCNTTGHFDFKNNATLVTADEQHTGLYSLKIAQGTAPAKITRRLATGSFITALANFRCLPLFAPATGTKYIVSAWTKQVNANTVNLSTTYSQARVAIEFTDLNGNKIGSGTYLRASGAIIDGWQKVSGTVTIPANAAQIGLSLENSSISTNSATVYYDDIRVSPFDAKIKTYAYNAFTNRLAAEMDEENYATFYEYDQEGTLIRVKKETERGVQTIKESRSHKSIQ